MYICLQGRPMTHLDDGRLRALLDEELGEPDGSAVRLHLEECTTCRDRMTELEERCTLVAQALGQLDTAAPPASAHAALLERIASAPPWEGDDLTRHAPSPNSGSEPPVNGDRPTLEVASPKRVRMAFRMPLGRAAILALFLGAGVATALPASPVRGWIASGWARVTDLFDREDQVETPVGALGDVPDATPDGDVGPQDVMPGGFSIDATGQEISIVLREIGSGTLIVVRIVPGGQAGVFADEPASFRSALGLIEVSGALDRVFVDLPQEATVVSIEVNDRTYVRREGNRIDVPGPVEERTDEEIRFRVP